MRAARERLLAEWRDFRSCFIYQDMEFITGKNTFPACTHLLRTYNPNVTHSMGLRGVLCECILLSGLLRGNNGDVIIIWRGSLCCCTGTREQITGLEWARKRLWSYRLRTCTSKNHSGGPSRWATDLTRTTFGMRVQRSHKKWKTFLTGWPGLTLMDRVLEHSTLENPNFMQTIYIPLFC